MTKQTINCKKCKKKIGFIRKWLTRNLNSETYYLPPNDYCSKKCFDKAFIENIKNLTKRRNCNY